MVTALRLAEAMAEADAPPASRPVRRKRGIRSRRHRL
jgi:hypothetical protein